MKVVFLSGSNIGTKTLKALEYVVDEFKAQHDEVETEVLDLAQLKMEFCDGRNYNDYEGDTKHIIDTIIGADNVIIGTPVFQASIPAALKNVFDLLPQQAFADKVVGLLVTAGSAKHYLVAEQQLKPILSFMKAQVVNSYVYIEEKDFYQYEIINQNVLIRIKRLVQDTLALSLAFKEVQRVTEKQF